MLAVTHETMLLLCLQGWVEKTPAHIFHLAEILRLSPEARIINIFRDGRDTVASFVKRGYNFQAAVDK